jgi:hypothetical protein
MSRKQVIATDSFHSPDVAALRGKDPTVLPGGIIAQGTRFYADEPIVLNHPTLFVDASMLPGERVREHAGGLRCARGHPQRWASRSGDPAQLCARLIVKGCRMADVSEVVSAPLARGR